MIVRRSRKTAAWPRGHLGNWRHYLTVDELAVVLRHARLMTQLRALSKKKKLIQNRAIKRMGRGR